VLLLRGNRDDYSTKAIENIWLYTFQYTLKYISACF
jgi:hypothetical protein